MCAEMEMQKYISRSGANDYSEYIGLRIENYSASSAMDISERELVVIFHE